MYLLGDGYTSWTKRVESAITKLCAIDVDKTSVRKTKMHGICIAINVLTQTFISCL